MGLCLWQNWDWQVPLVLNLSFKVKVLALKEMTTAPGLVVMVPLLKSSICSLKIRKYEDIVFYWVNFQSNSKAKYELKLGQTWGRYMLEVMRTEGVPFLFVQSENKLALWKKWWREVWAFLEPAVCSLPPQLVQYWKINRSLLIRQVVGEHYTDRIKMKCRVWMECWVEHQVWKESRDRIGWLGG